MIKNHENVKMRLRWQSRSLCAHLLLPEHQNHNLLLNNHRQEDTGTYQKKVPHIQGQMRSHNKTVGGGDNYYKIKSYTCQVGNLKTGE